MVIMPSGVARGCVRTATTATRNMAAIHTPNIQPRPQGLLLDDFQNGGSTGEDPGTGWNHVVQNLQKSWRFLSRDILRKPKQNGGEGEAKHRSKDALTLYTRQRWLNS